MIAFAVAESVSIVLNAGNGTPASPFLPNTNSAPGSALVIALTAKFKNVKGEKKNSFNQIVENEITLFELRTHKGTVSLIDERGKITCNFSVTKMHDKCSVKQKKMVIAKPTKAVECQLNFSSENIK